MNEEYKPIKGYEEYYQISNFGNVKRLERKIKHINNSFRTFKERLLKPRISGKDYLMVTLSKNNIPKHFKIHRLVAIHFIDNLDNLEQVNHLDLDKKNNNCSNLEWCSNRENKSHSLMVKNPLKRQIGVTYDKKRNKWKSKIRINSIRLDLGVYENIEDAINVYQEAKLKYNIIDKYS